MRRNRFAAVGLGAALLVGACSDVDNDSDTTTTLGGEPSSSTTVVSTSPTVTSPGTTAGGPSSSAGATTTLAGATTTVAGTVEEALAAVQDGDVASFVTALRASGLAGDLTTREVTIFAPDDDAFRALGEDGIRDLLANPAGLKELLLDHVVEGAWTEEELRGATSLTALSGRRLVVDSSGGGLVVEGARVVRIDDGDRPIMVHVIDRVLER